MVNLSDWIENTDWDANTSHGQDINDCLNTIARNDDDLNILGGNLASNDLNIENITAIKDIWDNVHQTTNQFKYSQQGAVNQLINYQWPLPSVDNLYTTNSDVLAPAIDIKNKGKINDISALNEYALNWSGFSLQKVYLDKFAIYLAPNTKVIKNILNQVASFDDGEDKRFSALAKYAPTIDNQVVTPLLTKNYDFDTYEQAGSFQNVVRASINQAIQNHQVVPVWSNYEELLTPTKILIFSVEDIANSNLVEINSMLKEIQQLNTNLKLKTVKNKQLVTKAEEISPQTSQKAYTKNDKTLNRRSESRTAAQIDEDPRVIANKVKKIVKWSQTFTNKASSNKTTRRSKSFMRPNRRHPENFNLAGKLNRTQYKRDIHIFLDTSGSISPKEYATGLQIITLAAKKLNVDIYFTSFSHITSETVKIPTKNKSEKAIYKLLMAVPKVGGGTDYSNVYNHIIKDAIVARKQNRSEPINIMLTDFAYDLSKRDNINNYVMANTYYMGYSVSNNDYKNEFQQELHYQTNTPMAKIRTKFA